MGAISKLKKTLGEENFSKIDEAMKSYTSMGEHALFETVKNVSSAQKEREYR